MTGVLTAVTVSLYGLATAGFLANLSVRNKVLWQSARLAVAVAILVHIGVIGSRCVVGNHPLLGTSGVISMTGLLLTGGYLLASFRWRSSLLGALAAPTVLLFVVASGLTVHPVPPPGPASVTLLKTIHLTLVTLGTAAFGLAALAALLYLVQDSALRRGKVGEIYRLAPSITTLDDVAHWLVMAGFPTFTLAVIAGVIWTSRLPEFAIRPEHVLSLGIWINFAVLVLGRLIVGLRGRRAAQLTLVGVVALGVVFLIYAGRGALGA